MFNAIILLTLTFLSIHEYKLVIRILLEFFSHTNQSYMYVINNDIVTFCRSRRGPFCQKKRK